MNRPTKIDIVLSFLIAIYNLAIMFLTLLWLFTNVFQNKRAALSHLESFNLNENVTYGLFFSGVLGGAFYCIRSLYQRIGETYTPIVSTEPKNTLNMTVWFFWYLVRPIQGGVLALIILTLINSKLMTLQSLDNENMNSFYTLVAVGFLCGFGSHEVIHKIQELVQVMFAKSNLKQSNSEQKVKENKGE